MPQIKLPKGSERYLALQRTDYQHPINHIFRKVRLGSLYDKYFLATIEGRRSEILGRSYANELESEYGTLVPALPPQVTQVLDIGCGLAGIDLFLYCHYNSKPKIHLLDRNGVSDIYYGYQNEGAFYNNLTLARDLLEANGLNTTDVHLHDVDQDGFPVGESFDLVLSLLSWGYHYPVSTYAQQVQAALVSGGTLILDIRVGTGGRAELEKLFGKPSATLQTTAKYERLAFVKE